LRLTVRPETTASVLSFESKSRHWLPARTTRVRESVTDSPCATFVMPAGCFACPSRCEAGPYGSVEARVTMDTALAAHRLHFAFTITFHYLFPQLTMGLALLI